MDTIPPDALISGFPDHIQAIAQLLRREVIRAVPDAIERVRPGWGLIGYDVPARKRTAYFGFVWPEVVHVHLGFEQGILMDDPDRHLLGSGKKVRWLTFTDLREVDRAIVAATSSQAHAPSQNPGTRTMGAAVSRPLSAMWLAPLSRIHRWTVVTR